MGKLTERELVFAEVSMEHNRSIRYIAKELGIDESTLRYRIERRQQGKKDGRKGKTEACEPFNDVIQSWSFLPKPAKSTIELPNALTAMI